MRKIEIVYQDTDPKLAVGLFEKGKLIHGTYPLDHEDLKKIVLGLLKDMADVKP
jgi:hypothetical protein